MFVIALVHYNIDLMPNCKSKYWCKIRSLFVWYGYQKLELFSHLTCVLWHLCYFNRNL